MKKNITPNLWFDGNAQDAVEYYLSVFPESKVISTAYYPTEGLADFQKGLAGKVLTIEFELSGNRFVAMNAGPDFTFNESISFSIECEDQAEIDYYWDKLSRVPEAEQCGWCKDRFGLSWQIVPKGMDVLMQHSNAFANLMLMKKIVIADFSK